MRTYLKTLGLFLFVSQVCIAQRSQTLLDKGWKFTRQDEAQFINTTYNDGGWQRVTIPHDWAIYGPFSAYNDLQQMVIVQDGQTAAKPHAGRTGGLPFVGVGWYRNAFSIPQFSPGKKAFLKFDGAMSNATVYVNGKKAGYWPYGYNTFYFDVSNLVTAQQNVVAVRLENFPESSRWYPGAGLYRNVHLIVTEEAYIPVWGTQITTPEIKSEFARVHIKTTINTPAERALSNYLLTTEIKDGNGKTVTSLKTEGAKYNSGIIDQELIVAAPKLWDTETPNLYTAVSVLYSGDKKLDEYTTVFGIRSIEIIPGKGFFLNGKLTRFKGVCNHHDLGPLGTAVNDAAIRRQLKIMKEMGANALRTSHNMPAPELVKACDEMGIMLMPETFDEWKEPKMKNGYNRYFDEWAEKDLVNLIHNYRNNPSVVMWCIGNEVPDQWTANGPKIARFLQDICHREDGTRPVTQGMDNVDAVLKNGMAAMMDVAGFNYRPFRYQEAYNKLPQETILGTETASTVSSRGVYKFPVQRKSMATYPDHQSSSYDVEHCSWSDLPEDNFIMHDDLHYSMGEFVWTGFDYLGEPTPYYTDWPSHSSLFGIVDLAGIPKDRYYLYRSHWNKKENTLHILPHWTWNGRKGQVTPVMVYTNYPSAELFINGKSQGRQTKDTSYTVFNTGDSASAQNLDRQKRYRLMWMNTRYEPGTVKVIAYDKDGKAVAEESVHTAGKPYKIVLTADRTNLSADGKDISFINVKVVDKDGNLCPDDTRQVQFKVTGEGRYKAVANGNSISLQSFQAPFMQLFSGQLTALVQSSEKEGTMEFKATAKGVKSASIKIQTSSSLNKNL